MKFGNSHKKIPAGLDYIAGLSWRLLSVIGLLTVLVLIIIQLKIVVIPLLVALLLAALFYPLTQWLDNKGLRRGFSVAISLTVHLLVIAALLFVAVYQFRAELPEIQERSVATFEQAKTALSQEPFNIGESEIDRYTAQVVTYAQENSQTLFTGIGSIGATAGNFFAGFALLIFIVIFFMLDGKNIWRWTVSLFPKDTRKNLLSAGEKGWDTLIGFSRSQIRVAGVDAVGIGIGALILQVPLAIPIAVLVFLGSFIPVVGAVVTGLLAVLVALLFNGWVSALLMLGVVLLVQFIEGNILQPFLMGKAVEIHPLAIVLAVAVGSLVAGIAGALFAVPIVAVLNTMAKSLISSKKPISSSL